jgi:hypothetical protein
VRSLLSAVRWNHDDTELSREIPRGDAAGFSFRECSIGSSHERRPGDGSVNSYETRPEPVANLTSTEPSRVGGS